MEHLRDCDSFQLVDGDGIFDKERLDKFTELKLANCGNSYSVISIIGPQSSGKSTLLNHLFGTNFEEMNATARRGQTTRGIWLGRCSGAKRCTLVLDLEGTDGVERARTQDGAAFEKQSALFALVVSNIVLININCKDVGLENAASRPLLRTVFEAMIRVFGPPRVTLMFVLRDKAPKTPSAILEEIVRRDVEELWESIEKPEEFKQTELSKIFNVKVQMLPNYEYMEEKFKEQVATFRQRLFLALEGGEGSRDHQALVPGSEFSASAKDIWKCAKENKDFDVPSYQEMIAGKRCEDVFTERTNAFTESKEWHQLLSAAQPDSAWIPGLGMTMNNLVQACLNIYDRDTQHYSAKVRDAKRNDLSNQLLKIGHEKICIPALWKLQFETVEKFEGMLEKSVREKNQLSKATRSCKQYCIAIFDQGCAVTMVQEGSSEASRIRDRLVADIDIRADNEKEKADICEIEKTKRYKAVGTTLGTVVGAAASVTACVLTGGVAAAVIAPAVIGSSAVLGGSSYFGACRLFDRKKPTPEND